MNIQFNWFLGVVEDRLDPLKLGRCRVRILGQHTENKKIIPTEELPWAWPMMPITAASMNGIGAAPLGPVEGTWIVGFYRDGLDSQEPVIMGTLPGIPSEYPYPTNKTLGFLDPRESLAKKPRKLKNKKYPNTGEGAQLEEENPTPEGGHLFPKKTNSYGNVIGESDTNRLARNEKISDSIVAIKKDQKDTGVPIAGGGIWNEPSTPYDSSYPYNHVYETESGHVIEFDDTRGGERIHVYHRSGTFIEVYPDGVMVQKVVGNNYRIVLEEQYDHIQNRYNLTVDGPMNILVQNDANIQVKGNMTLNVGGDLETNVGGDYALKVAGILSIEGASTGTVKAQSLTVGAATALAFKATSITTAPGVEQSLQALISGGLGIVRPKTPSPQTVSVSAPDSTTLSRNFPKEVGPYTVVKEDI